MADINDLKKAHDYYVTVVMILSSRVQFYSEEFQSVTELIEFNKKMAQDLKAKIEDLETKEVKVEENGESTDGTAI